MRSNLIILHPSLLNQYLCLSQRDKYLTVEQFVSQLPVERLDISILPGAAGVDEKSL